MARETMYWRRVQRGSTKTFPFVWIEGASWHPIGRIVETKDGEGRIRRIRAGEELLSAAGNEAKSHNR